MYIVNTKHFDAPIDQVFAVFTDFEHIRDYIESITRFEVLTDGPVGLGTRFRETRIMFKKESTEEMKITEWDPPKKYVVEADSCGCHYTSIFIFREEKGGTTVETSVRGVPLTFTARVMSFLLGWMMTGSIRKMFDKDLEDLKLVIEGGAKATSVPA